LCPILPPRSDELYSNTENSLAEELFSESAHPFRCRFIKPHVAVSQHSMPQNRLIMFWNELRMRTTPSAAQQDCLLTSASPTLCSLSLSLSLSLSAYRARFAEAPRLLSRVRHSRGMMEMAYICSNQSSCMLLCGGCSESMTSKLRPSFPSVVVQRVLNGKRKTSVARPYLASLDTSHQSLGTNAP
jgi:hypothetical protein